MASMRACGTAAGLLSLAVLAGCGGGSGNNTTTTTTTSSPSSSSASMSLDACVVNTWTLTKESQTESGQPVPMSGGTGEKLTISADGAVTIDDSNVAELDFTNSDGSSRIKETGRGTGKVTTTDGRLHVVLDPGSTLSNQRLDANGAPQGTPYASTPDVTLDYTCTPGKQLQLSQSQGSARQVVTYTAGQ